MTLGQQTPESPWPLPGSFLRQLQFLTLQKKFPAPLGLFQWAVSTSSGMGLTAVNAERAQSVEVEEQVLWGVGTL